MCFLSFRWTAVLGTKPKTSEAGVGLTTQNSRTLCQNPKPQASNAYYHPALMPSSALGSSTAGAREFVSFRDTWFGALLFRVQGSWFRACGCEYGINYRAPGL